MRSLVSVLPLAAALAWGGAARAQDFPTVLPNNYDLMDILNQQRIESAIGAPAAPALPRPVSPPPASAAQVSTSYRASPQVSARVRQTFLAETAKTVGAEGAEKFRVAMSRGDPVASWAGIVRSDGLAPGDVADAMAAYWIINWIMANGAENTRAQALGVRSQVRDLLAGSTSFRALDEGQRQEMAEALILNFLIQHAAYSDALARQDKPAMQKLGDAAVARFRAEMGVDLRRMTLTDRGMTGER